MYAVVPIVPVQPPIQLLAEAARAEGWRFIERLLQDWDAGSNRFDAPGECLLGATAFGSLLAVGGLNVDPYDNDGGTARLRHLYVRPDVRRQGIAASLVEALVDAARPRFGSVRLRTDNPAAARLYEQLGFARIDLPDATHRLTLRPQAVP